MAATQTEEQALLKLVLNQDKSRVLFAVSGKDFVDALFSFLTLPLGSIVRLLNKDSTRKPIEVGCLNSLYDSVAKLDEKCFHEEHCREMLLYPRRSAEAYCKGMKLNIDDPVNYFLCEDYECRSRTDFEPILTTLKNMTCGHCCELLNYPVDVEEQRLGNGFSNSSITFIITDCLRVIPNSLVASLNLLKDFGIDDIHSVQNLTMTVTKDKVLDLLLCSLLTKNSLTTFFTSQFPSMRSSLPISQPTLHSFTVNDVEQINVKLIRKKSNGKILFAEGREDFASFIFGFLALPLGGVLHMLKGNSGVGSLDELYMGAANLDKIYFVWNTKRVKKMLVAPKIAPHFKTNLLPISKSPVPKYYYHEACGREDLVTTYPCTVDVKCQNCNSLDFVDPIYAHEDGFLRRPMMYTVTDGLSVKAISSTSAMSMLEGVFDTPLSDLEEVEASIGIMEGLNILKASLSTGAALTNGFYHLFSSQEEKVESEDENSISNFGTK